MKNVEILNLVNDDKKAHPFIKEMDEDLKMYKKGKMKLVPPFRKSEYSLNKNRQLERQIELSDIMKTSIGTPNFMVKNMNDRTLLHRTYNTKIIMIKVWRDISNKNPSNHHICGLQAFYLVKDS